MDTLCTAEALATGAGRHGHVRSTDGRIDVDLAIPESMGGSGKGANPEELFAAGYAACFHSALQSVARRVKADLGEPSVGALVGIGANDAGGFQLDVTLEELGAGGAVAASLSEVEVAEERDRETPHGPSIHVHLLAQSPDGVVLCTTCGTGRMSSAPSL